MRYEVIGEYVPGNDEDKTQSAIRSATLRQGQVYKNIEAFYKETERVCCIPELTNTPYTRNDFLELRLGQEDMVDVIFLSLDWQESEAWREEQFRTGEIDIRRACNQYI